MTAPDQVVSLFGGVGGIDLGAERAGLSTRLICEIDKACRRVLAERFPSAVLHDDVRTLTADDLRAAGAVPERTVVTAGFPCQDLSVAGRRRGMGEGTRSGLYWHVDRLLAEFRPAWVVLENVPGLLSAGCACPGDGRCVAECGAAECEREVHAVSGGSCGGDCIRRHGGVMGAVLGSLAQRGYGFAYRVLDARHFGVPQRRRRVVIVGRLGDTGATPAQVLLEPEGMRRHPAARSEAWSSAAARAARSSDASSPVAFHLTQDPISGDVAPAMGTGNAQGCATIGVAVSGYDVWNDTLTGDIAPTMTVPTGGANRIPHVAVGVLGDYAHALTAEGADASEDGSGRGTPIIAFDHLAGGDKTSSGYAPTEATQTILAGGGAMRGAGAVMYAADCTTALDTQQGGPDDNSAQGGHLVAFAENQRGEVTTNPHVNALARAGGKPGQGYPAITDGVIVRRLTPLECERLQGYPDGWAHIDTASDSQIYKEMGNSVAVPVFTWVFNGIRAVAA